MMVFCQMAGCLKPIERLSGIMDYYRPRRAKTLGVADTIIEVFGRFAHAQHDDPIVLVLIKNLRRRQNTLSRPDALFAINRNL